MRQVARVALSEPPFVLQEAHYSGVQEITYRAQRLNAAVAHPSHPPFRRSRNEATRLADMNAYCGITFLD